MGVLKGQLEYNKHMDGKKLTRGEAIKAMCYECNGFEDSRADCENFNCPLYQYMPYRGLK